MIASSLAKSLEQLRQTLTGTFFAESPTAFKIGAKRASIVIQIGMNQKVNQSDLRVDTRPTLLIALAKGLAWIRSRCKGSLALAPLYWFGQKICLFADQKPTS
jgi:hypothetical protein